MTELKLTDQELQALVGLIDAGIRATGLRAVKDAAALLEKLEQAQKKTVEGATSGGVEGKKS